MAIIGAYQGGLNVGAGATRANKRAPNCFSDFRWVEKANGGEEGISDTGVSIEIAALS